MSALAVAQLLENAQTNGLELNLDTAAIENSMMLDAIEKMSLDGLAGRTPSKQIGKLVSCVVVWLLVLLCMYWEYWE